MDDALFTVLDDDRVLPTELSRGPWAAGALHGGPVAAIVARAAEAALAATGSPAVHADRLTLDLERPVPLAPLEVRAAVVRPGRKVQVAEVSLHGEDGRRLVRATVLAIRRQAVDLPGDRFAPVDAPPPDRRSAADVPMWQPMGEVVAFHKDAVQHRFVGGGGMLSLGPSQDWMRLRVPVVAGEEPSPLQRVVAAADFVNGLSGVLPFDGWTFINPDLTVTLHRLPVGEWIGIDAVTRLDVDGVGTAEGELFDERGRLGRCVQTLLVEPR
ncbi:thioesterase family protein [Aquihabitans sp. G128]|uniref:thioesterase family protein n=1 Tax=Aquihabitans sp. G128 TaxID=2849779 RepID=UPI001C21DD2E|nr:thioesterase family protein [Aquihabitans sp. G128]QXC60067.1 thioesterase family protein [Aquihabitans sp. G128]